MSNDGPMVMAALAMFLFLVMMGLIWWGVVTGRTQACSAACGDHWTWQDRCVCLTEATP